MYRFTLVLLVCGLAATSVQAQTRTYECTIRGTKERSWIQPLIFFAYDTKEGRVIVSDPAILGFNDGQPVEGTLVADNARRITVKWSLDMISASQQRVTMDYRATYVKGTQAVNVIAQPRHFSGNFNAGGTCKAGQLP
jgi:hypothetical protein